MYPNPLIYITESRPLRRVSRKSGVPQHKASPPFRFSLPSKLKDNCEGNKDRLMQNYAKNISLQNTQQATTHGTKHKPCGNSIVCEEIIFNSCFDFDFCVKERWIFFCGGHHLENPAEKESSYEKQPWIPVSRANSVRSARRKSSIPRSL